MTRRVWASACRQLPTNLVLAIGSSSLYQVNASHWYRREARLGMKKQLHACNRGRNSNKQRKNLGVNETRGRPRVGLVRVCGESRLTPRPHGRAGADEVRSRGKVALYLVSATSPRLGSLRRETFVERTRASWASRLQFKMNLQRRLASERERRIDLGSNVGKDPVL